MDSKQEWIAQLEQSISAKERYLADCENKQPTEYLRGLMMAWAGTDQIDFEYLAGIIRYELEEDRDCLWKANGQSVGAAT